MNNFKLRRFSVTIIILIMLTIFLAVPLVKVRFDTIYNIDYIVKNIYKIEIVGLNKENINEKTTITSRDDINLILNNHSSSFSGFFRHPFAVGNCSIYEFYTDLHIESLLTY